MIAKKSFYRPMGNFTDYSNKYFAGFEVEKRTFSKF